MSWNYRIFKKQCESGITYYEIHEVYYDKNGKIVGVAENPSVPFAEPEETQDPHEEVAKCLELMMGACKHDILDFMETLEFGAKP